MVDQGECLLLSGIVHFGASNNSLAFFAYKRSASTYAAVRAGIALHAFAQVDTVLVMVSVIVSIYKPQVNDNETLQGQQSLYVVWFTFALKVRGSDISTLCIFLNFPDFNVSFKFINETHWWGGLKGVEIRAGKQLGMKGKEVLSTFGAISSISRIQFVDRTPMITLCNPFQSPISSQPLIPTRVVLSRPSLTTILLIFVIKYTDNFLRTIQLL